MSRFFLLSLFSFFSFLIVSLLIDLYSSGVVKLAWVFYALFYPDPKSLIMIFVHFCLCATTQSLCSFGMIVVLLLLLRLRAVPALYCALLHFHTITQISITRSALGNFHLNSSAWSVWRTQVLDKKKKTCGTSLSTFCSFLRCSWHTAISCVTLRCIKAFGSLCIEPLISMNILPKMHNRFERRKHIVFNTSIGSDQYTLITENRAGHRFALPVFNIIREKTIIVNITPCIFLVLVIKSSVHSQHMRR